MKMGIASALLLLFVVWGSMAGCTQTKGDEFPQVQEVFTTQPGFFEGGMSEVLALSPDGERLINAAFDELELRTGRIRSVFTKQEGIQGLKWFAAGGGYMGWSVDGRYFAATQIEFNERGGIADRPAVVIDTQTRTARYYPGAFTEWSAVDGERFVLSRATVVERSTGEFVSPPNPLPDFREEEVLGYGAFLWSVRHNFPLAVITADPPYIGASSKAPEHRLYVTDWEHTDRVQFYTDDELERVISWGFDPTGRYVLLMIWEWAQRPENPSSARGVTDTKLVVVDWRRGEQRELFRLSQLGDGKVAAIGWLTTWHWSADGSTIIVPRTDGSVVVLKVDYPARHRLGR